MKITILAVSLVILLAVVLSGCTGTDTQKTPVSTQPPATATTTTQVPTPTPVVVKTLNREIAPSTTSSVSTGTANTTTNTTSTLTTDKATNRSADAESADWCNPGITATVANEAFTLKGIQTFQGMTVCKGVRELSTETVTVYFTKDKSFINKTSTSKDGKSTASATISRINMNTSKSSSTATSTASSSTATSTASSSVSTKK